MPVPGGILREAVEFTNDARRDIPSTFICTGYTAEEYQTYARENPDWAFLAGIPELRDSPGSISRRATGRCGHARNSPGSSGRWRKPMPDRPRRPCWP